MSVKKKVICVIAVIVCFCLVCAIVFAYKKSHHKSEIIPQIPKEERISIEDDTTASIKQNQEYYSQYTADEIRKSENAYRDSLVSNAIFFYDFHDADMLTEIPTWVPNEMRVNYTLSNGEVDIDRGASAQILTIENFAETMNVSIESLNVRLSDTSIVLIDYDGNTYQLYYRYETNHDGADTTYYVVPYEE